MQITIEDVADALADFVLELHNPGALPPVMTKEMMLSNCIDDARRTFSRTGNLKRFIQDVFLIWRTKFDRPNYDLMCKAELSENRRRRSSSDEERYRLDMLLNNPDLEPSIAEAARAVVNEIRSNERLKQITQFEKLLIVFLENPDSPTPMSNLIPIVSDEESAQSKQAVRNLIERLNEKFSKNNAHSAAKHVACYQLFPD